MATQKKKTSPTTKASTPTFKIPKFLRSLYSILQAEDPSIVAWVQNQDLIPNRLTAFHILDMDRFEAEILPRYFKHRKFASFQRQLNNFGFRKWTKTQSSGVCTFSHNNFPPDPSQIGYMRASMREQWRQKSPEECGENFTFTISPEIISCAKLANQKDRRRTTPSSRSKKNMMKTPKIEGASESFTELIKTSIPNAAVESNAYGYVSQLDPNGMKRFPIESEEGKSYMPLPSIHSPRPLLTTMGSTAYEYQYAATPSPTSTTSSKSDHIRPFEYHGKPQLGGYAGDNMDGSFTSALWEPWLVDAHGNPVHSSHSHHHPTYPAHSDISIEQLEYSAGPMHPSSNTAREDWQFDNLLFAE